VKFLRHLLVITKLDREKLAVQSTVLEIKQYLREWLQHVERMDTDRIHKRALKKGKRSLGRPRKRWKDQLYLEG
jgi:uncharacterized protein (UPF0335 family)